MLWFSKDEKKPKEEIERIKKTIEKSETISNEFSNKVRANFSEHPEYTSPPTPVRAPLFIKLEKYDMIIKRIQMLDEIIRNTMEIMKINDEIERIKNEAIGTLLRNLQEAIKIINFLNRELVKPMPFEPEIPSYSYTHEIKKPEIESLEEHVSELKKQLEELKKYF
ncbi:MAG TPA: hypothetical protein EYH56_02055 [Nanoarchaeota archaeon]|nr:hypothetical protein [Nanoarchaeota archaeon]